MARRSITTWVRRWRERPAVAPEAIAEFQAALRIQPDAADAHYNLGWCWSKYRAGRRTRSRSFRPRIRTSPISRRRITTWATRGAACRAHGGRDGRVAGRGARAIPISPKRTTTSVMPTRKCPAAWPMRSPSIKPRCTASRGFAQAHNNLANALAQTPGRLTGRHPGVANGAADTTESHASARQFRNGAGADTRPSPGAIAELEAAQRIRPDPQVQEILNRAARSPEWRSPEAGS